MAITYTNDFLFSNIFLRINTGMEVKEAVMIPAKIYCNLLLNYVVNKLVIANSMWMPR